MSHINVVKVAVSGPFPHGLDYICPRNIDVDHVIGTRVYVPVGRRYKVGVVLGKADCPAVAVEKLKCLQQQIDTIPLLDAHLMQCLHWMADYYHESIGDVIVQTALPALLSRGVAFEAKQQIAFQMTAKGKLALATVKPVKQKKLLHLLSHADTPLFYTEIGNHEISRAVVKALLQKAWIEAVTVQQPVLDRCMYDYQQHAAVKCNRYQQDALNWFTLHCDKFAVALLYGVTGSGKTEVYMQMVDAILQQGKQALVLVPEIALTPQILSRFSQRFVVPVLPYHSELTDKQRLYTWFCVKSGEAKIIIGTRSAVFIPFQNLGVIVVDEEHDLSFKQQTGVRYCARDVAIKRASILHIPVILGSATPSLETLHNAQTQKYMYLKLPQRAGCAAPAEQFIIDMRQQPLQAGISKVLQEQMAKHLAAGQQVMLFLNRRGYSSVLLCHDCGWTAKHEACGRHFTVHRQPEGLHCHHCEVVKPLPLRCPQCGAAKFVPVGVGTQRLENYLKTAFPDKKMLRVDRDVTRHKGELHDKLQQIYQGSVDILIGTQMLAKGHHFPKLTMVGIIDIDAALFSHDFRALERMGQIIVQVAGRAGRVTQVGAVYLQTHQPQHPLLHCLLSRGYTKFARIMLRERRQAGWPPFSYLAVLLAEAEIQQQPHTFLTQVSEQLQQWQMDEVACFGPLPSLLPRRAGYYRQLMVFQAASRKALHIVLDGLHHWLRQQKMAHKVRWRIDVDPQEF